MHIAETTQKAVVDVVRAVMEMSTVHAVIEIVIKCHQ
jgi:hypothetical protein